jgi:hypothetical protein
MIINIKIIKLIEKKKRIKWILKKISERVDKFDRWENNTK